MDQVVLSIQQSEPIVKGHISKPPRAREANLLIRIDARARETLQQQIYADIRRAILDGIVAPGARLQSSRALADDLRVSRTTTLLVFEQLTAEGYLTAQRGSGTFVAQELPDDLPRASSIARRASGVKHPPLSKRGSALVSTPPAALRAAIGGPPCAFRLGVPALDLFPVHLWSQLAGRRLRSLTLGQLDYGDSAGFRDLRAAIADHVQSTRGTRCTVDQVLIVAGAQRGLALACDLLLDPGDAAWLEEPAYPGARSALAGAGARIVPVPVDDDGLDVDAGRRLARHARLAYVTPSHQFPLAVPMSLARRLALLRWASEARAWVIEDDYDAGFRYGARPLPCLHGLDIDGRVIYIGSFSKTMFPALRLGFLIVPPDLLDNLMAARRAADVHPPMLEQTVLADFMAAGHYERHLRRMRSVYRERVEALMSGAQRYCAGVLTIRPVRTGLHAIADLDCVSARSVTREALNRGLEMMPLGHYYTGPGRNDRSLVLGFAAVRPEALLAGMEQLARAIDAAKRPGRSGFAAGKAAAR